jgi:RNA polymerase sigma factor (sigma-70 family)
MKDEELVLLDRWCGGDNAAGNELFVRHYPSIYRFFANKVEGDVEDLAQETFLACVRQRHAFLRQSSFRTYLFAIARYTLFGYLRKRAGRGQVLAFDERSIASLTTSVGGQLARRQEHARLLEALRALPVEQQLILELHYWEGMEREQLAEVFEIEPGTTRTRLFRARAALRAHWTASEPDAIAGPSAPPDQALDAWAQSLRAAMLEVGNASEHDDTTRE